MAAKNATPYVHKVEIDGETVELTFKPFDQIPTGLVRKNRKDPEAAAWDMIEWGLSEDDLAAFDKLPIVDVEDILDAWQESSKVTLGE